MKIFNNARHTLTLWYLLVITSVSAVFSLLIYRIQVHEIQRIAIHERLRIESSYGYGSSYYIFDDQFLEETKRRMRLRLFAFNGLVLVTSGALGYFLAGRTLAPIEDMVREQRRFISDAAHELRTPLTAMKASLEVYLRDQSPTLEEARSVIVGNNKDVDRLQSLADSLLTLSQIQEGRGQLDFVPIDLAEVIETATAHILPIAKKQKVSVKITPKNVQVEGYFHHLVQLITILLDNAVKYSPKGKGEVSLTVRSNSLSAMIAVRDNGIGIKKEDLPHVFDRFFRADSARFHNGSGGYGLGLSIAQKIVRAHKGSIDVTSTHGRGTTFTVILPIHSV